jgi:hypothetical protein
LCIGLSANPSPFNPRLHIKKRNQEFANAPIAPRLNINILRVLIFDLNAIFIARSITATPSMASIVAKMKNHVQTVEFEISFDHWGSVGIF